MSSGKAITQKIKTSSVCLLGIRDWRTLHLLHWILQLTFSSLWLFLFRCGVSFKIKYRIILWRYIFLLLLEFSMKILPWVSLNIADWRILCLLCIILQFNFNEVWLFFIQTNQTWIRYVNVKEHYCQKCVILALSHLLYIPK